MRAGRAQKRRKRTERTATPVEDGFTLVEVLISLTIVSIAVITIVGGMNVLVLSSALNRSQGDVGAVVRRAAEAVKGDAYMTCAQGSPTTYDLHMPAVGALPENAAASRVLLPTVLKITDFAGTVPLYTPATGWENCAGNANVLQIITVQDTSAVGGISQKINVVKGP